MSSAALTLGAVVFQSFEVPDHIPFGGEQALTVHKLIGGVRQIDAMGRDDMPLAWSGRFQSFDALARARQIDAMRVSGQQYALTWDELSYTVVIHRFVADFEKAWQIPYSIECEVVSDNYTAPFVGQGPSLDDQMAQDLAVANAYAGDVADPTLNANLSTLTSAVQAVPTFIGASQDTIASVTGPLSVAQVQVTSLIDTNGAVVGSASTVGGLTPGDTGADLVASLTSQTAAMQNLASLYPLNSLLARMATNLAADGSSGTPVPVAGADLTRMAVQAYGDAGQWPLIAQANGLTDPIVSGVQTVYVPAPGATVDGVLQP